MRKHVPLYEDAVTPADFFSWKIEQRVESHRLFPGMERPSKDPHHGKRVEVRQLALTMLRNELASVSFNPKRMERLIDIKQVHAGMDGDCHVYWYYITGALNDSMLLWMQWCRARRDCRHPSYDEECMSMVMLPSAVPGLYDLPSPRNTGAYLPAMRKMERDTLRSVVQESMQERPKRTQGRKNLNRLLMKNKLDIYPKTFEEFTQPTLYLLCFLDVPQTNYGPYRGSNNDVSDWDILQLRKHLLDTEDILIPEDVESDFYEREGMSYIFELSFYSPRAAIIYWLWDAFGEDTVQLDRTQDLVPVIERIYERDKAIFVERMQWLNERSTFTGEELLAKVGFVGHETEVRNIKVLQSF